MDRSASPAATRRRQLPALPATRWAMPAAARTRAHSSTARRPGAARSVCSSSLIGYLPACLAYYDACRPPRAASSPPPARGGVRPPAAGRVQRLRRRGDHARAPRAGDEPAPRLLLPSRGRPPRDLLHAHAPYDLLRVEGRRAPLHHRGRRPYGRERRLVLPGAGPGLPDDRGPRRLLPGARGCLLRRRRAGAGTGRRLLRRLDHARRDRTVQGRAGDGGLVGSPLRLFSSYAARMPRPSRLLTAALPLALLASTATARRPHTPHTLKLRFPRLSIPARTKPRACRSRAMAASRWSASRPRAASDRRSAASSLRCDSPARRRRARTPISSTSRPGRRRCR